METSLHGFGLAFLAGMAVGAAHAAALWSAVRRLAFARSPVSHLLSGALLRVVLVAGLLYLVMDGQPLRLAGAMLGFLAARLVATRLVQASAPAR